MSTIWQSLQLFLNLLPGTLGKIVIALFAVRIIDWVAKMWSKLLDLIPFVR